MGAKLREAKEAMKLGPKKIGHDGKTADSRNIAQATMEYQIK